MKKLTATIVIILLILLGLYVNDECHGRDEILPEYVLNWVFERNVFFSF